MASSLPNQSAPNDAFHLFDPDTQPRPSYLSDKFVPIIGGFIGALIPFSHNFSQRRPLLAGAPSYLLTTAAGVALGIFVQRRNDAYWAERDAVYRHYISLHPEDFQPKERIRVGDMFKSWLPIR